MPSAIWPQPASAALYEAVDQGDLEAARKLHAALFELNQSIFLDTNPFLLNI